MTKQIKPVTDAQANSGGSPVVRGSVPYIEIKRVGEMNSAGKSVLSLEYGGKQTSGDPTRPLFGLIGKVMKMVMPMIHYSSKAQCDEDVATLKALLDRIQYTGPEEIDNVQAIQVDADGDRTETQAAPAATKTRARRKRA